MIRLYRKNKNLTLEDLAKKIYKSKATISKYEKGEIAISIDILFDIAKALGISINQLIEFEDNHSNKNPNDLITKSSSKLLYVYTINTINKQLRRGVISLFPHEDGSNSAMFFHGIQSYDDYKCSEYLYYGHARFNDYISNYYLVNQCHNIETVMITALAPIEQNGLEIGLI